MNHGLYRELATAATSLDEAEGSQLQWNGFGKTGKWVLHRGQSVLSGCRIRKSPEFSLV